MSSLIKLIRSDLQNFKGYSSARDEAKNGAIWLNANESPYDTKFEDEIILNRYPEKQPKKLIEFLAELYQVNPTELLISRGSDEVIDLLTRLFCRSGQDAILICPPTFGMYAIAAELQAAKIIEVPLLKQNNFQLDCQKILSSITDNVKIIFLCSPNNPTGNLIPRSEILTMAKTLQDRCIVIVDEAYIEFSNSDSLSNEIKKYNNLVVLRTLSKAYGLAAVRCGVLLANHELIEWVLKIMPPYPTPGPTTEIVLQSLRDKKNLIQQRIKEIMNEREQLVARLHTIKCIKHVWPSTGNFLLVETTNAANIMQNCAENGIVLRNMHGKPGLEQCIRISIGLPEQNDKLILVLQQLR